MVFRKGKEWGGMLVEGRRAVEKRSWGREKKKEGSAKINFLKKA